MRNKIVCKLITDMLTLIMWHNRFSENENEAVEAHIPQHRDSKTKKPWHQDSKTEKPRHRDSKTKKPQHQDSNTKKPWHQETETNKPWHRDSKAFFQKTKSQDIQIPRLKKHDIEIPRPKSYNIKFLWNSDLYAPWYIIAVTISEGKEVILLFASQRQREVFSKIFILYDLSNHLNILLLIF